MPEKTAFTNYQVGLIFIIGIFVFIGKKVLDKTIDRFFKKTIDAEFVTTNTCKEHRNLIEMNVEKRFEKGNQVFTELKHEIGVLNGLVLISIMNDPDISKDQKDKAVVSITTKHK